MTFGLSLGLPFHVWLNGTEDVSRVWTSQSDLFPSTPYAIEQRRSTLPLFLKVTSSHFKGFSVRFEYFDCRNFNIIFISLVRDGTFLFF